MSWWPSGLNRCVPAGPRESRVGACLPAVGDALEVVVAQILDREAARLYRLLVERAAPVRGPSIGELGSPELPPFEFPAHMQFDGGGGVLLIAPTAAPERGQLIGQADATAVFQDHRTEATQQRQRDVVGRLHHQAARLFQHGM